MQQYRDPQYMARRIRELEEKVRQLRDSRRVLMHLIERMEKESNQALVKLQQENRRLLRTNRSYALALLRQNRRIAELESGKNFIGEKKDF